jgi:hypothetical protein
VLAGAGDRLVLTAGRFALITGMAYMTYQGFAVPRWVLVALVGFAGVVGGPVGIYIAVTGGNVGQAVIAAVGMAGYVAAGWLLALSPAVAGFIRQRRDIRNRDIFQG